MLAQKPLHWQHPRKIGINYDLIIEGFDIALQLNPFGNDRQELLNAILENHKPSYLIHNNFTRNYQSLSWSNYPSILTNELRDRLVLQSLQSNDSNEIGHILRCLECRREPSHQEVKMLKILLAKNTFPEHKEAIIDLIEKRHYSLDTVIEVDHESLRSPAVKSQD